MAQQTAIEIFWNQLPEILPFTVDTKTELKLIKAFDEAKELNRQQIIKAVNVGFDEGCKLIENIKLESAEQYYTQTYGK